MHQIASSTTIYISNCIMFRAIVLIASLIGASAFAPLSRNVMRSSLKVAIVSTLDDIFFISSIYILLKFYLSQMSFDEELGVLAPMGFWDPLGENYRKIWTTQT